MRKYEFFVYIVSSYTGVLYIGVTNNLSTRVSQHKNSYNSKSFTSRYRCSYLLYYEKFNDIRIAIGREKQIKKYSRKKKHELIREINPGFEDLSIQDFSTPSNFVLRRSK